MIPNSSEFSLSEDTPKKFFSSLVNWNIVWDVIKEKLPSLKKSIEKALRELT